MIVSLSKGGVASVSVSLKSTIQAKPMQACKAVHLTVL